MRYSAQPISGKIVEELANRISLTLKSLRKAKGWSLDVASKHTNVSKAMLGQIERGESSPTIATLWKIASGFDVSFSTFMTSTGESAPMIHRRAALQQMHHDDDKIRVMPLFPFDEQLQFEVFIIELLPGCEHLSPPHQPGVREQVIVTQGAIEVFYQDEWHPVGKNEGFEFSADKPHGYRNRMDNVAVIHDMIHYPKS